MESAQLHSRMSVWTHHVCHTLKDSRAQFVVRLKRARSNFLQHVLDNWQCFTAINELEKFLFRCQSADTTACCQSDERFFVKNNGLQKLQRSVFDNKLSACQTLAGEVTDCDQEVLESVVGVAGTADTVEHVLDAFNSRVCKTEIRMCQTTIKQRTTRKSLTAILYLWQNSATLVPVRIIRDAIAAHCVRGFDVTTMRSDLRNCLSDNSIW